MTVAIVDVSILATDLLTDMMLLIHLMPSSLVSGRLPPMDDPMSRIPSSYSPPSHLSAQRDSGRNKSLPSLQGSLSNPLAAQNRLHSGGYIMISGR